MIMAGDFNIMRESVYVRLPYWKQLIWFLFYSLMLNNGAVDEVVECCNPCLILTVKLEHSELAYLKSFFKFRLELLFF